MQRDRLARVVSTLLQRAPGWIVTPTIKHDAILDALEAGDQEAADRTMTAHLEHGKGVPAPVAAAAA
jgi:DNA-binding GntR family transcriptional regulator